MHSYATQAVVKLKPEKKSAERDSNPICRGGWQQFPALPNSYTSVNGSNCNSLLTDVTMSVLDKFPIIGQQLWPSSGRSYEVTMEKIEPVENGLNYFRF